MADGDLTFTIASKQAGVRLDAYLASQIEGWSRARLQRLIENEDVLVNGKVSKPSYKLRDGDEIEVELVAPPADVFTPENIPLDIVYEDDVLVVVSKPAGLVVHPAAGTPSGTFANALAYHFGNLPLNSSERPGLVHRIDKDTTGLLVVAKTDWTMSELQKQFAEKSTEREYVALVWGNVLEDEGTIESYIGRHKVDRMQMASYPDDSNGAKYAVTHYKVLERLGYVTLVSCRLETGRTHQIRVHMKAIGHTLFNDERYGGHLILKGTTFTKYKQFVENTFKVLPRQALHAKTLGFMHPVKNEFMRFDTVLPDDMLQCIERWRNYSSNHEVVEED